MEEMTESDSFDDFSVEMGDFEVKKTKKFDRVWKVDEGGSICQIPLVHDGIVYFGACNKNVYAVSIKTGNLVWKFPTQGMIMHSSPVIWNDRIFIGSFDHHLYALDFKTGELIWKFNTQGEVAVRPCVEDGKVFFGSRDNLVYCVDAESGNLIWKHKLSDEIVGATAVHKGRLFIGSFDKNFYCIDTETGQLLWKHPTQGEIQNLNPPLIKDGRVYIASFDNNLYSLEEETGKVLWKFNTGTYGNYTVPIPYKGILYQVSRDGILYALTNEGELVWKYSKKEMLSIPEINDDKIYIGCEDQNFYCLDMNGNESWKFSTQGAIYLKPVMWKDIVIFPSWDCHMYAVNSKTRKLVWKFRTEGSPSYLPPPHESFELVMKVPKSVVIEEKGKGYDFGFGIGDEANTSDYKSKVTYRMSTQYGAKGKYQVDSREEEF